MIPKKDIKFDYTKGTGPGGQRKNKVLTCVRATHIPTGISVVVDSRSQAQSKKMAVEELEVRLEEAKAEKKAADKKAARDFKIKNEEVIRDYDFKSGVVHDRRSGKKASVKDVLYKGKIDLLRGDNKFE